LRDTKLEVVEQGYEHKIKIERKSRKRKSSSLLIYVGRFYKGFREPFALYNAVSRLKDHQIRLELYGNIDKQFLPTDAENITYKGVVDHAKLIDIYQKSDILVFIDNFYGVQVPGKVLEILSIERPILFIYENDNSPTFEYLNSCGFVEYVKNDPDQIRAAILKINEKYNDYKYEADIGKYSWDQLSKKYTLLLNRQ
jgi:hypothetical protein